MGIKNAAVVRLFLVPRKNFDAANIGLFRIVQEKSEFFLQGAGLQAWGKSVFHA